MEAVQGINKGTYISDISSRLSSFNNYAGDRYINWQYSGGTFYLVPKFETSINSTNKPTYTAVVNSSYGSQQYTYRWYINNVLDESITGNSITKEADVENSYVIDVLVSDGNYYALASVTIPRLTIEIEFDIDEANDKVTGTVTSDYTIINQENYIFQWYTIDAAGISLEEIEGETSRVLVNLEDGVEYKLIATNKNTMSTVEGSFIYGTRTVIYVDYTNGRDNYNTGLTPQSPVSTLSAAYGKLSYTGTINTNIIVIMGTYSSSFLNNASSTTYNKNVTFTGIYDNVNYNGVLYFERYSSTYPYKYLTADTGFQHLTLRSSSSNLYLYLQGYDLVMGEGIIMTGYASADTNQGLITGSAPAFHIFAGWLQYNYATLPRNNTKIVIKSGAYGRIVLGGSPGGMDVSALEQTTSRNFTGSSFDDMFNVTVDIDIKNSTKGNYAYDVNLLVGGSACGNTYANITENIKAGSIGRILGASLGDTDRPSNWDYPINTHIGTSTINVTGGTINELYGACLGRNMNALTGSSSLICDSYFYGDIFINITGGTITGNIYGAGAGGVTGYHENSSDIYKSYGKDIETSVNINISGGTIEGDIYGGGYGYTEYLTESVTASDAGALYGDSYIRITNSPTINGDIYGAGCGYNFSSKPNIAQMIGESNIEISGTPTISGMIFGAGAGVSGYANMAKLTGNSNITSEANLITNMYGGGNIAKTVGTTNININSGTYTGSIYGGGDIGVVEGTSYVYINSVEANNIFGGGNQASVTTTNIYNKGGIVSNIYGGGNKANVNTTNIYLQGGKASNIFGGSNQSGTVTSSNIYASSGTATNIYGGNNQGGTTTNSNIVINNGTIQNIYGGNNQGGTTNNPNINIIGGIISNIYGGGNRATVPTTNVQISGGNIQNVFGGGNAASVDNNTNVNITGGTINLNIYGGGNEGIVNGNTNVKIKDAVIGGSAYAGGNGVMAIVNGNTNITISGRTIIGNEQNAVSAQKGSVFGGGNAAATGIEANNNSTSTVNIVGATIYGNVYGGANTSVVYGYTDLNIGHDAVQDSTLTLDDIYIRGTIFGGGEANASGSEVYDYSFISVTQGIDININGNGHTKFETEGSIFGSGNASSTTGDSTILIKNYGTKDNPCRNISIQRATTVTMDNSCLALFGATDRTNEYSSVKFSLSRIDELKIKNGSIIFLECGANLLKKLSSLVDINGNEEIATVTIDETTGETTKNVDNRIYLYEGKNFNVALEENVNENDTLCGDVDGMTFLGLYNNSNNPATSTGFYHYSFENGDKITNMGTFRTNSYVKGAHKTDHDITVDGFYTNYNDKDNEGFIKTGYVGVTPADDTYYMWIVGEAINVRTYHITLTASKYATLGTHELVLDGFSIPNTKFILQGFSSGLNEDISLIDNSQIEAISQDEDIANTMFGLSMRSGKNGWRTDNKTSFYTTSGGTYNGNNYYVSDNSITTPTLVFCLYHSQNLNLEQELGEVTVRFQVLAPIDDLTEEISYIDIIIDMNTLLNQDSFYEAAITPGEEFELFTTTETNITENSMFSTYYSLLYNNFSESDYYADYTSYKRVLVSRDSNDLPYVFKANTKIIMLDMVTNKHYYYIVTSQDETNNIYMYELNKFIEIGSIDSGYDEVAASNTYYNSSQDLIYENFIFHVDVSESNIAEEVYNNTLLIELQDSNGETLIGVLNIQRNTIKYSIYKDRNATIDIDITSEDKIYLGDIINLTATTNFTQNVLSSKTIYDTRFFNSKMGIQISIFDINGNQLNSDTLLGINFEYDGAIYYPRIDGTTRIKIADRVSNVLSKIKINTINNTKLATGDYTIKVETFGSPDGIYYGLETSSYDETQITIINGIYGLKATTDNNSKIIDKTTGKTLNDNNIINVKLEYSSALNTPIIMMELQRRDYTSEISLNYEAVDLANYTETQLTSGYNQYEYLVTDAPTSNNTVQLNLKENLVTGTYKLVFKLYDGENYIGATYEYFIVK